VPGQTAESPTGTSRKRTAAEVKADEDESNAQPPQQPASSVNSDIGSEPQASTTAPIATTHQLMMTVTCDVGLPMEIPVPRDARSLQKYERERNNANATAKGEPIELDPYEYRKSVTRSFADEEPFKSRVGRVFEFELVSQGAALYVKALGMSPLQAFVRRRAVRRIGKWWVYNRIRRNMVAWFTPNHPWSVYLVNLTRRPWQDHYQFAETWHDIFMLDWAFETTYAMVFTPPASYLDHLTDLLCEGFEFK